MYVQNFQDSYEITSKQLYAYFQHNSFLFHNTSNLTITNAVDFRRQLSVKFNECTALNFVFAQLSQL